MNLCLGPFNTSPEMGRVKVPCRSKRPFPSSRTIPIDRTLGCSVPTLCNARGFAAQNLGEFRAPKVRLVKANALWEPRMNISLLAS